MAAPAGRRLADDRRPVLRRPGAVAAAPTATAGWRSRRCGRRPARRRTSTTWSARRFGPGRRPLLDAAYAEQPASCREGDPEWRDDVPVRVEAIPVVRDGPGARRGRPEHQPGAAAHAEPAGADLPRDRRRPGPDDRRRATSRCRRRADGQRRGAPRVGDGLIRLDADGTVDLRQPQRAVGFPPARARRRPGRRLAGRASPTVLRDESPVDESAGAGRDRPRAVAHRAWPRAARPCRCGRSRCTEGGRRIGALVLLRDVTELRRRDRELVTKDATIREIHHRVKNNLQTVAALLRLQARRMPRRRGAGGARGGGAPGGLDRDRARDAEPGLRRDAWTSTRSPTGAGRGGARWPPRAVPVRTSRRGTFGLLPAEVATPLAMVLTELLQNAVEHGFAAGGGTVEIEAERRVEDDEPLLEVSSPTTGAGCRRASTPVAAGWASRSSPRWWRT